MEYNDEIARDMLQIVRENAPQTTYFSEIATSLSETANEFDQLGSGLASEVDSALMNILQIVEGK